ncbi:hypothetical protein Ait01nite_089480 [Actinoplanes italicus]|uniref:Uncharacterized protein n=1 Tax=Actinoplanes italicus TaxID=113567 RepID=A0A2T0JIF3_9ACTN|nr:hypothetical protein [Actinoplanes italicus]PRX07364.1 hypothetical protein CLV67_14239 [Actinoplanes italicus]GIE35903.1 hypothetical protein Ait01nite_089480 [Actinoplanes italicus]
MHLISPADERLDALHAALDAARALKPDGMGLVGYGIAELRDGDGRTKQLVPFRNLITDAGDLYIAGKVIVGIAPASPSAPTAANGMKLGTGGTAVAKSGAGGALVTYLTASNVAFDATYPQTANLGGGLGVNSVYRTTWAAGVATNSAITEVAIVNDQASNATSTAGNTYSRALITTVNKGASDSLQITWNWKALGA